MNLEDRIRSSARSQAARYEVADDLLPRIDRRRRQRAARRLTASAAAAVVLFGGSALALTALRDRDRDSDPAVADSTELTVDDTMAPVTTVAPTAGPPTTASTQTATTIGPPDASAPELNNIPQATEPVDDNAPMPTANPDGSIGIEFWNVGSWGDEPVFGSGCGSSGQLGDTIPDGIWAGFVVDDGADGSVGIDVLCIYGGAAAQGVLAGATATTLNTDPNYLIVNNSTRVRNMPMAAGISLRLAERRADGRCWDHRSTSQWSDIPADRQAWVRIHGGVITWILVGCAP